MKTFFYAQHWNAKIAKILGNNYFKFFLKSNFFVDFLVFFLNFYGLIGFVLFISKYRPNTASFVKQKSFVCVCACLSFINCHSVKVFVNNFSFYFHIHMSRLILLQE